ncbi:4-hydroxybenzoyl-CoA thioesterase [Skermanella aerolata]|uniref:4-hydroxybenzoyl-CoA thioesterase n=1 Tax=Skermanella aerolata TaxID=393310 RepID=A0A512DX85_9PROT|nr:thioesterase family protein [Skermanella aerolata]KJB93542.1 4-hydroxybenzoyl-CoA thioesterase [Skermanella aerolata KACC 11604]GEO41081.1 4-hydroxybenzoyl-CoA thioesterase [Skermanella aerolata]
MTGEGPLRLYRARVAPEWVDYNGHLSEAYYVLIFGHATDALLDAIGMDEGFRTKTGRSVYTVDARILYLREVACGEEVEISTWIAAADRKRMLVQHAMYWTRERLDTEGPVARTELVLLSVGKPGPRAMAFDPVVFDTIKRLCGRTGNDCPVMPKRWQPDGP